jgi:hypothetical protein
MQLIQNAARIADCASNNAPATQDRRFFVTEL